MKAQLSTGTKQEKCEAADQLGRTGDPKAVLALIRAWNFADPDVREAACAALVAFAAGHPHVVWEAVARAEPASQAMALATLDAIGVTEDPNHRTLRILALRRWNEVTALDPEAISVLMRHLEDADHETRHSAAARLIRDIDVDGESRKQTMSDRCIVAFLASMLAETGGELQDRIIKTVGAVGDQRAAMPLLRLCRKGLIRNTWPPESTTEVNALVAATNALFQRHKWELSDEDLRAAAGLEARVSQTNKYTETVENPDSAYERNAMLVDRVNRVWVSTGGVQELARRELARRKRGF